MIFLFLTRTTIVQVLRVLLQWPLSGFASIPFSVRDAYMHELFEFTQFDEVLYVGRQFAVMVNVMAIVIKELVLPI